MSGSLTDWFSRLARLKPADRRIMLIAALAGGFGAVFGVPIAGCVFALEVQSIGRMRYDALVPALDRVAGRRPRSSAGLGVHHEHLPPVIGVRPVRSCWSAKVALAGLAFGLTARCFSELTHGIQRAFAAASVWPPLRPFIGGLGVIGLTYLVGNRDYNGLSIDADRGVAGGRRRRRDLRLRLEAAVHRGDPRLGLPGRRGDAPVRHRRDARRHARTAARASIRTLMAAVGLVAVFAGAANVPIACTVMGAELFGADGIVLFAVACVVSYVFSSHHGIYHSQRVDTPKAAHLGEEGVADGDGVAG